MRARNREINIFNMSLLDILTGMLGAFLFLMLGLLPFYAKVVKNKPEDVQKQKEVNKDLEKQLDDLKKLADLAAKGPLTPEQIEQLRNQLAALQQQIAELQNLNKKWQDYAAQLENEVNETKQQLAQAKEDTSFWAAQDPTIAVMTDWDSDATDIDVMVRSPEGQIYGAKTGKLFGREILNDGTDSHGKEYKSNYEGVLTFLSRAGSGEYLVFYKVPKDAAPASYANLRGYYFYHETIDRKKSAIVETTLGPPNASAAKPGGIYAWVILVYDASKHTVLLKAPTNPLPDGILLPQ